MRLLLVACVAFLGGCSAIVGGGRPADPPSAPTEITLSPAVPGAGDVVVATATGSADPAGTKVRYRFEWRRDDETVRIAEADALDTLSTELTKEEAWTLAVTPVTEDGRTGEALETTFTVANTAPILEAVGLNVYRPLATDTVRAYPSGYADVDGDPAAIRYRWHVGTRPPVETTEPTFDFRSLTPAADPASEQLAVEAIPSDGDADNAPLTLGPFPIAPDETGWRQLQPTNLLGVSVFASPAFEGTLGDFVEYDELNRRFVVYAPDSFLVFSHGLWAYRLSDGWVQLHPEGAFPELVVAESVYDSTLGAERILVAGFTEAGAFELHALDVTSRGLERWKKLPVSGGPSFRCFFTAHYDADVTTLFMYGGVADSQIPCEEGVAVNELWLLSLADPEAPVWFSQSPLSGLWPIAGATAVNDPTRESSVLFFGGTIDDGSTPARIHRIDYDVSSQEDVDIEFTDLGLTLLFDPWGVSATADPESGLIVGGLGASQGAPDPSPVELVWTYDPAVSDFSALKYRRTELFDQLNTGVGVAYGEMAWEDGRIVFWPGRSVSGVSFWGLGEIVPGETTGQYEWRTLAAWLVDYPGSIVQAGWRAGHPVVFSSGQVFEFDFVRNSWAQIASSAEGPGPRGNVNGGTSDRDDGFWTVSGWDGGAQDMTPWRFDGTEWQAPPMNSLPPGRYRHTIFDTGCGSARPLGVMGGLGLNIAKETWVLDCEEAPLSCTWNQVVDNPPAFGQARAGIAYDGQGRVLLVSSNNWVDPNLYALDACNDPDSGWQSVANLPDPLHGNPWTAHRSANFFALHRLNDLPDSAEFLYLTHEYTFGTMAWRLSQVGDSTYQWDLIQTPTEGPIRTAGTVSLWDETNQRLLYFDGFRTEVWELRLRD